MAGDYTRPAPWGARFERGVLPCLHRAERGRTGQGRGGGRSSGAWIHERREQARQEGRRLLTWAELTGGSSLMNRMFQVIVVGGIGLTAYACTGTVENAQSGATTG